MPNTDRGPTFAGQVVLDPVALAALLRGPNGPVQRRMIEDAELVRQEARRLVGVSRPDPVPRRGPQRRPGTLRDKIVKRAVSRGGEVVWQVGAEDPIALFHHEGTEPHVIRARRAPRLVFFWPRVGRVVYFRQVNHPGTRPNRFLTNALAVLRRRY